MDDKDLLNLASGSLGPSNPFGRGNLPVGGIVAVGLIIVLVLYITQHPHSFLSRILLGLR